MVKFVRVSSSGTTDHRLWRLAVPHTSPSKNAVKKMLLCLLGNKVGLGHQNSASLWDSSNPINWRTNGKAFNIRWYGMESQSIHESIGLRSYRKGLWTSMLHVPNAAVEWRDSHICMGFIGEELHGVREQSWRFISSSILYLQQKHRNRRFPPHPLQQ